MNVLALTLSPLSSEMDSSISEFGHSLLQIGFFLKFNNRIANSVEPDETAQYEPQLDRHCSQRYPFWSIGMKG